MFWDTRQARESVTGRKNLNITANNNQGCALRELNKNKSSLSNCPWAGFI